jgi:hypothetical protein
MFLKRLQEAFTGGSNCCYCGLLPPLFSSDNKVTEFAHFLISDHIFSCANFFPSLTGKRAADSDLFNLLDVDFN